MSDKSASLPAFEYFADEEFAIGADGENNVGLSVPTDFLRKLHDNQIHLMGLLNAANYNQGENEGILLSSREGAASAHVHDGTSGAQILYQQCNQQSGVVYLQHTANAAYAFNPRMVVKLKKMTTGSEEKFLGAAAKYAYSTMPILPSGNGTTWDVYIKWSVLRWTSSGSAVPNWNYGTLPVASWPQNALTFNIYNKDSVDAGANPDSQSLTVPSGGAFAPAYALDSMNGICVRSQLANGLALSDQSYEQFKITVENNTTGWTLGGVETHFAVGIFGIEIYEMA